MNKRRILRHSKLASFLLMGACRVVELLPDIDPQSACGAPVYLPGSPLHLEPYLQSLTQNSAQILFALKEESTAPATVEFFQVNTDALQQSETSFSFKPRSLTKMSFDYTQHQAQLEGLTAGAEYCYRIKLGEEIIADQLSLRTAKPEGAPTRVFVIGDFGDDDSPARAIHARMVTEFNEGRPDLLITTGDNAYFDGTYEEIDQRERALLADITALIPYYPSWGNHDYETNNAAPSLDVFSLPENTLHPQDRERYYSFDWGDIHFIALDSELPFTQISDERDDDMLDWLQQDLAQTTKRWKIAYLHRPPYSSGKHGSDLNIRATFAPIFEANGVQLVLSGHDHTYERTKDLNGVVYVVTGGGGQYLYRVGDSDFTAVSEREFHFVVIDADASQLTLKAITIRGDILDTMTISQ